MPNASDRSFAKKMPETSDKGSQPYSRAFRHREPTVTVREARESKWLGKIWIYKNASL